MLKTCLGGPGGVGRADTGTGSVKRPIEREWKWEMRDRPVVLDGPPA